MRSAIKFVCRFPFSLLIVSMTFTAHTAVDSSKTNFWKNLESGKSQKLLLIGSSISNGCCNNGWPDRLVAQMNQKFGANKVTLTNLAQVSAGTQYIVDAQSKIASNRPDAIIYETNGIEVVPDLNCNPACAYSNVAKIISATRKNLPNADILIWTCWPWMETNAPNRYDAQLPLVNNFWKVAADSGVHLIDTWHTMDSIYRADPNKSCYPNRNKTTATGLYCPLYITYLADHYHPSTMCGDKIIIPTMLKVFNGTENMITFKTPAAGSSYSVGQQLPVAWTVNTPVSNGLVFKISFNKGLSWSQMLSSGLPADSGSFMWTIPATVGGASPVKDSVLVRADEYNGTRSVTSGYFKITANIQVVRQVTRQNGVFEILQDEGNGHLVLSAGVSSTGIQVRLYTLAGKMIMEHSLVAGQSVELPLKSSKDGTSMLVLQTISKGRTTTQMLQSVR